MFEVFGMYALLMMLTGILWYRDSRPPRKQTFWVSFTWCAWFFWITWGHGLVFHLGVIVFISASMVALATFMYINGLIGRNVDGSSGRVDGMQIERIDEE